MIRDGQPIDHSGHKQGAGSILMWGLCFLIFLGSLFALGYWTFEVVWIPGLICLVLSAIAFFIPKQLLGRADTVDYEQVTDPKNVVNVPGDHH